MACTHCGGGPIVRGTCTCCGHGCWLECWVCGDDIRASEAVLHYKFNQWVCTDCADCPGHSDYYELLELPENEGEECLPEGAKRVQDQGSQPLPPPPPPPPDECIEFWDIGNGTGVYFCALGGISSAGSPVNNNLNGDFLGSESSALDFSYATRHHAPFTLKRLHVRCCEVFAAAGWYGHLEILKNGVPTGLITQPKIQNQGDIAFVDCNEAFSADDTLSYDMLLYDPTDTLIRTNTGNSFQLTGTFIYETKPKFLFSGIQKDAAIFAPKTTYHPIPTNFIGASTGMFGMGANTPISVSTWRFLYHSGPNDLSIDVIDRDGVSLYNHTVPDPSDTGVVPLNVTMTPIPDLAVTSYLGIKEFTDTPDPPRRYNQSLEYTLTEHPNSVLALAYATLQLNNNFYVGPGQFKANDVFTPESSNVAMPIKGRIHKPIAYNPRFVQYNSTWTIELQLNNIPVWVGTILPGDYYTIPSLISLCVQEGDLIRWHAVRSGGSDNADFGFCFLFGPEGA